MTDDSRSTPGLLRALQIAPEQQVGFMFAKLGEISRDMGLSREADKRMEDKIDAIQSKLAQGETTFALQAQAIAGIDTRVKAIEERDRQESSKQPPWWVTSLVAPVAVVLLIAIGWFILEGALSRANGPLTTVNRQETITTPAARP